MLRNKLWLLFLLTACGEAMPIRVVSSRDVGYEPANYTNFLSEEDIEVLDEAFAIVGFPYEFVDHKMSALQIEFVDVEETEYEGRQSLRTSCRRIFRAERDPIDLAHEIGHALIDEEADKHRDEEEYPDNVMLFRPHDEAEFTYAQMEIMEQERRMLVGCPNL